VTGAPEVGKLANLWHRFRKQELWKQIAAWVVLGYIVFGGIGVAISTSTSTPRENSGAPIPPAASNAPPATDILPHPPGATGYDISWPQCGGPFPPPSPIAIVGVTRGTLNIGPNPCYVQQAAWAGANLSSYIVASPLPSPSPAEAMGGPYGTCNGNVICESSNFGYFWAQHWISYSRSLGISPTLWWLDVEVGKGWGTSSAQFTSNAAVISGALNGMRTMGVFVGIYASSLQWGQITGNQPSYPGIPLWAPGGTTVSNDPMSAMAICTGTIPNYSSFASGTITLAQFGYVAGPPFPFDQNYACPR